jgi:hypothetical protein
MPLQVRTNQRLSIDHVFPSRFLPVLTILTFSASLHHEDDDIVDGASVRWCINYGEAENIQLCLITLPKPASTIEGRPAFRRDTCPGLFLYAEDLFTRMTSGCRPYKAPLPTLFNGQPDRLRETLATSPPAHLRVEEGKIYI